MPQHAPFTALCRQLAAPPPSGRADLHVHTTSSDGAYTPAQVAELAGRAGLAAVAVTDHDTLAGVAAARAAAPAGLEVIAGVEVTAEHDGREVHLLGYFVHPDDPDLGRALGRLRDRRHERFREMAERLRDSGVSVDEGALAAAGAVKRAPGRRALATLLYEAGSVGSVREAFTRYLADGGLADVPKARLPLAEAAALVRGAGGVASVAHPSAALTRAQLAELRGLGVRAVEADYPTHRPRWKELRAWAAALGLAVTGGSDCHGPGEPRRGVGAFGVTADELAALRRAANEV